MVARLAKRCGKNVAVFEGVYLRNIETMEIGDNVSIHEMCYIEAKGGLKIGSDVSIAHGSSLLTTEHGYECGGITRDAAVVERAVEIMNDVWIGCGVRVLAGCTVGEGAVVGAGAVVTRDIPDRTIAVGIPAKPLRSR
jgi:acetyltransferase-like isoleucine patch superfamily enzyme